jgi:hypothetical protein
MKKSILGLGLILVFLLSFGLVVQAQTGKEISEPVTSTWYSTSKVVALGEDRTYATFEAFGIIIADAGEGLFHESTNRFLGSRFIEKSVSTNDIGYGYYLLKNGDKVFYTTTWERKPGATNKAKTTIIGGTGKCAGIQGSWELTGYPLRPAADGIFQSYNKLTIKYTLP